MEEEDIYSPLPLVDKHTADEFLARNEALSLLIQEAIDNNDQYRLEIFQESLAELLSDNPTEGRHFRPQQSNTDQEEIRDANALQGNRIVNKEGATDRGVLPFRLSNIKKHLAERRLINERARKRAAAPLITANDAAIDYYDIGMLRMMNREAAKCGVEYTVTME